MFGNKIAQSVLAKWLPRFLIGLPLVSLGLSAICWLKYGVDLPFFDDWRKFSQGHAGSFDPSYLFEPENDTLYPVGKFLDSLAFWTLGANSIPYQLLSLLGVLGGLLILQWRLLSRCASSFWIAACAFSLTIFMLQPDSYWGRTDLAYHQAVPLLCVLGVLNLLFAARWRGLWSATLILVLGLLSGFVYISGAFAFLSLGLSLWVISAFISGEVRRRVLIAALASLAAGIPSVIAQLLALASLNEQNHRYSFLMAYPWSGDFWLFMLGKMARSILLPLQQPAFSLLAISAAVILLLVVGGGLMLSLIRRRLSEERLPSAVIFLSLLAVIFIYLGMVSAGRAIALRPAEFNSFLGAFSWGFFRFHFFWVTLLWPWLAVLLLNRLAAASGRYVVFMLAGFASLMVLSITLTDVFAHDAFYRKAVAPRLQGLECLRNNSQQEGAFYCPQVHSFPISHALALANARKAGASFVRYINYVPIALGAPLPIPLFRYFEAKSGVRWRNAKVIEGRADGVLEAAADPGLEIDVADAGKMKACGVLEVNARFTAGKADFAQIFYQLPGNGVFNEADSQTVRLLSKAEPQTVTFQIMSKDGFLPKLRFDPVQAAQRLQMDELEVRCRANREQHQDKAPSSE
ncbi:hypothetical protein [Pseudomonas subflava]|uniref:hypothetical protein n=1 Tax=Pseudomonas subflava TaxID=2952933 RepID=UPI0020794BE6|nr:hypothetical protein [Pseudomonas subflava]